MAINSMGVIRKILIFLVLTAGIIMLGRLAPQLLGKVPALEKKSSAPVTLPENRDADTLLDSTNALPAIIEDTTGGKWQQKLFTPLLQSYGLPDKHIKPRQGFFEIVLPKGKPIHDYALDIEILCRQNGITVEQGVELHPIGRSIEYHLQSNGQHIKLRASLGNLSMAGSAKLAIIFIELDSLKETELAALESAPWDKSLTVNAYSLNQNLKKLRFTAGRNELLLELPMEPASYPYVDPGPHALFIHHTKEEVQHILMGGLDSIPKAMGFVTKFGNRAIENLPLLDKVFQYAALKNLVFLDLTGSQRSLARQSAAAQGARCRTLQPFRDSLHIEEELMRRALQAEKTGEAMLVLPYTQTAFKALEMALSTNAERFNELGIELVTYSALLSRPGDSALPDLRTSIAKPKVEAKPLVKPIVKSNSKVKAQAKTQGKVNSKTTTSRKTKPSPKLKAKPAAKPVAKPTAKPKVKSVVKPAVKKSQ